MAKSLPTIIDELIQREGGFVDHPSDRGGPTRFGITQAKARAAGYTGAMSSLPRDIAVFIYERDFITFPGIGQLYERSPELAAEALDTGVNMGATVGVAFLQTALNAFNREGKDWKDLRRVDGRYGPETDAALAACMKVRASRTGPSPVEVLLAAMNAQQGARYLDIIARRPSQEAFGWGWFAQRVATPA